MGESALTDAQLAVLHLLFDLPESAGFVLAGGAGLLAAGISTRPTDDVDLFTAAASILEAGDALERAAVERGWSIERLLDATTFRRLAIAMPGTEAVLVDLAKDGPPLSPRLITLAGPTYPAKELCGPQAPGPVRPRCPPRLRRRSQRRDATRDRAPARPGSRDRQRIRSSHLPGHDRHTRAIQR